MKITFILLISLFTGACSTMNFVNGPVLGDTVKREQWHHDALFSLIELSQPFNVTYFCDDKQWEKITIELSTPNVLASASLTPYTFVYNPWTIEYQCRDSIDN